MKKLIVVLFALTSSIMIGHAGPIESGGKEVQQTAYQPVEQWYRDQEWNIDLFGTYAFPTRPYQTDRYLGEDHAWGGGIDANYMFMRYFGIGAEGYALDADRTIGQASGNLILRYPIPGTRFAPYLFAGGGVIFNGSRLEHLVQHGHSVASIRENSDAVGMGQVGGGLEFRITPHIGVINDFTWNVLDGPRNNFGMVRAGLRFAF